MERGYLKLWRKSIDSLVFNNPELWKLWCWCLMKASYKKRWKSVITGKGETEVELMPGQFIFGRKTSSRILKMKESTVRNRMEKLKKIGKIEIKPDTHYSIITICNWGAYQPNDEELGQAIGQATDNQRTGKGHKQEGKERKEGKEVLKDIPKKPDEEYDPFLTKPIWLPKKDLCDIILHRKKHKSKPPKTERAFNGIYKQLQLSISKGHTLEDCLDKWFSRGWASFDSEWMENGNSSGKQFKTSSQLKDERTIKAMNDFINGGK